MIARRIVAALLTLFTLHLNLLGADAACAKHGTAGDHGAMQMSAAMTGAMSQSHDMHNDSATSLARRSATDTNDQPCEIPSQSNCCRALVSCSLVFSGGGGLIVALALVPHSARIESVLNAPRSEIVSPDPPPPKA